MGWGIHCETGIGRSWEGRINGNSYFYMYAIHVLNINLPFFIYSDLIPLIFWKKHVGVDEHNFNRRCTILST